MRFHLPAVLLVFTAGIVCLGEGRARNAMTERVPAPGGVQLQSWFERSFFALQVMKLGHDNKSHGCVSGMNRSVTPVASNGAQNRRLPCSLSNAAGADPGGLKGVVRITTGC